MKTATQIEALLYIKGKPLSIPEMAASLELEPEIAEVGNGFRITSRVTGVPAPQPPVAVLSSIT